MKRIGRVDFESNEIDEFLNEEDLNIVYEDAFEISDHMMLRTRCDNPSIWVNEPLMTLDNKSFIRLLPTKLDIGYKFYIIPRERLVEGSVYLITDQIAYKYNLRFNETK